MPCQTQKEYWQDQWNQRDFAKQVAAAEKKAWWGRLTELLDELNPDDLVVEAGCGLGQFVYCIQQRGHRVVGVDVTEETIRRVRQAEPGLDLRVMDVRRLDLPEASVALMLSLGVLEHFKEGPDQLLREASRVIRPGGTLFVTVPYSNLYRRLREPWRRAVRRAGRGLGVRSVRDSVFYQYTYGRADIVRLLAQHDFEVESTLLHHTHVAIRKDLERHPAYRLLSLCPGDRSLGPAGRRRRWAARLDGLSPALMSHICLYVARRRPEADASST